LSTSIAIIKRRFRYIYNLLNGFLVKLFYKKVKMENKLEFIIPFLILGALFLPKILKGMPIENVNELTKILFVSVVISVVIVVLRYLKKIDSR